MSDEFVVLGDEGLLGGVAFANLHPVERCTPGPCVVHNPSDHHMRPWPLVWRHDRRMFERLCTHGVGHPDPDCLAYRMSIDDVAGVHGCCGCCMDSAA